MSHLLTLKGSNPGQRLPLERARTVLGRELDCDVVLETKDVTNKKDVVSRKHAIITCDQGEFYIEDGDGKGKESRNHTFINGVQVPFPGRVLLKSKDVIRICDFSFVFHDGHEDSSSSVDAAISHNSSLFLAQPAEKLKLLLEITNRLSHTLELDSLLPEVVEILLQLFKQADRGFLILQDDATGMLVCRSFKTRRPEEESRIGFSASIVEQCLRMVQGLLSNNPGQQYPESESIAGLRIRSVMCAPLWSGEGSAFGVLLLDSHSSSKTFSEEDLNLLMGVASQASIALSNARFHRQALAKERLDRDLELAHEVVQSFLPARLPEIPGYAFFACYESALEVGGDYYDLIPLAGQRLGILVGDVTGKGVAAALVMARLSAMAWACLRTEPELAAAVGQINTLLQPLRLTDRFVTLAALLLDPARQTLTMVNAGHPPPLLLRGTTGMIAEVMPLEKSGPPLGVVAGYAYEAHQVALQPGDCVVLFSDGVTEALDVQGRQLGMPGLRAVLQGASEPPRVLGERILQAVKKHAAGCSQHDDITLVCFARMA